MNKPITSKPTFAQQLILNKMSQGHVLSSMLDTKYCPFGMNAENGGNLRNPHVHHTISTKTILISTIKALLAKKLIVEKNRYICSSGTWGNHETETWCINYKLNLCAQCYENPIADNGLYCQKCADQIGKAYMDDWTQRTAHLAQS
jgi:hypothetical protein